MVNFLKNLSPTEIALILLILGVFFGRKFITSLGRMSGETVKEIKKVKKGIVETVDDKESDKKKEVAD